MAPTRRSKRTFVLGAGGKGGESAPPTAAMGAQEARLQLRPATYILVVADPVTLAAVTRAAAAAAARPEQPAAALAPQTPAAAVPPWRAAGAKGRQRLVQRRQRQHAAGPGGGGGGAKYDAGERNGGAGYEQAEIAITYKYATVTTISCGRRGRPPIRGHRQKTPSRQRWPAPDGLEARWWQSFTPATPMPTATATANLQAPRTPRQQRQHNLHDQ